MLANEAQDARTHHLLIAGTGRAGTSFLVQYLQGVGYETSLAKGSAAWFPDANAGLEDDVLSTGPLPYVVKSPWLYETIDAALARPDFAIDAVIIPVRELVSAAASRCINEVRYAQRLVPVREDRARFETFGHVPGGVVYSLDVVDQARLLAVGFHQLIERLVDAEIPIVFLSFPRLVTDAEYLYRRLNGVLPGPLDHDLAIHVHDQLSEAGKVRVEAELPGSRAGRVPTAAEITAAALARETAKLRHENEALGGLDGEVVQLRAAAASLAAQSASLAAEVQALRSSSSWKLTAWLRWLGDRLRAMTARRLH